MKRKTISTVSLITQGKHKFYTFTIDSELLAETCFVSTREEDPDEGFQRELDKNRARDIAHYIDQDLGTIPSSIILSAQEEACLRYSSNTKSVTFNVTSRAFLIIDGQHRVFGFKLAKSKLRIPVVVYDRLTRQEEARLFIDINSKQKGVRPELLLDIKKLADTENSKEMLFREIYDTFHKSENSILYNKLSPSTSAKGKISRATFNGALSIIYSLIEGKDYLDSYEILNNYLIAFTEAVLKPIESQNIIVNPIVFRATISFLQYSARRVKDKFGAAYSIDNFYDTLNGMRINKAKLNNPGKSYQALLDYFVDSCESGFTL